MGLSWQRAGDLKTAIWDGSLVVYDRTTGDTHCLDPVLTSVFQGLADSDEQSLTRGIAALVGMEREPDHVAKLRLDIALAELERLGLARRV